MMMRSRDCARNDPYFSLLHLAQFALAITVCALYGIDIDRARKARVYPSDEWIYAVIVGGFSAATVVLYYFASLRRSTFVWVSHLVLLVMWAVLLGIFAKMFINVDPHGNRDLQRMKNALWVVFASTALWFIGFLAYFINWRRHRYY
ncbi:uncharacterized protein P884DRAFT_326742 [Thermothelomyces heterothallicus CBS 202.75]|uniref:uncharacterized protein n=1 Tax=Thermothelomyces heterothallicus CBS 202.75 TaxID=1149848 RepID=UPI003741FEDF